MLANAHQIPGSIRLVELVVGVRASQGTLECRLLDADPVEDRGRDRDGADGERGPGGEGDSDADHRDERAGVGGMTKHPVRPAADDLMADLDRHSAAEVPAEDVDRPLAKRDPDCEQAEADAVNRPPAAREAGEVEVREYERCRDGD